MKTKTKEFNVDFIGGSGPLTKEEEKRISDIIKSHKSKQKAKKSKTKLKAKKKSYCLAILLSIKDTYNINYNVHELF